MPAFQATRVDLNATLKDGKGTVLASAQSRIGKSLVVAQVALSLMLMVAAGLFVRTLINVQQIPTGFKEDHVILFQIDTATTGLTDAQLRNLLIQVQDRLRQIPGVEAAAFSRFTFNQGGSFSPVFTYDQTPPEGEAAVVRQNLVGDDYFNAMGIPIVSGRLREARYEQFPEGCSH